MHAGSLPFYNASLRLHCSMANDNPKLHDAFMKSMLADPIRARTFFLRMLPAPLVAQFNLDTLQAEERSYIRDDLKEFFTDALFTVRLSNQSDKTLLISLLLEHKSYPDNLVSVQLLSYLTEGYRTQIQQAHKQRTKDSDIQHATHYPILPILFYHGSKDWSFRPLHRLFEEECSWIHPYLPTFEVVFINLHDLSDQEINLLEEAWLRAALLTQKYSHDPVALLERFVQIFTTIEAISEGNFLLQLIRYFTNLIPLSKGEFQQRWNELPNQEKTASMNWLETMIQEEFEKGIEKGIEEGIEKGQTAFILRGIEQGFTLAQLSALTGFSRTEIEKIIKENNYGKS